MAPGDFEQRGVGGDHQRDPERHGLDGGKAEALEVGGEDHHTGRAEVRLVVAVRQPGERGDEMGDPEVGGGGLGGRPVSLGQPEDEERQRLAPEVELRPAAQDELDVLVGVLAEGDGVFLGRIAGRPARSVVRPVVDDPDQRSLELGVRGEEVVLGALRDAGDGPGLAVAEPVADALGQQRAPGELVGPQFVAHVVHQDAARAGQRGDGRRCDEPEHDVRLDLATQSGDGDRLGPQPVEQRDASLAHPVHVELGRDLKGGVGADDDVDLVVRIEVGPGVEQVFCDDRGTRTGNRYRVDDGAHRHTETLDDPRWVPGWGKGSPLS